MDLDTQVGFNRQEQGKLIFTPENWSKPQEVRFAPVRDDDAVQNNKFTISHEASGGGYDWQSIPSITVNVRDDDEPGILPLLTRSPYLTERETDLVAYEGDRSTGFDLSHYSYYSLAPLSEPQGSVTITMRSSNGKVTVSPRSVTFDRRNWQTLPDMLRIIVRASEDSDQQDERAIIRHTVTGSDPAYRGIAVPDLRVLVEDND